MAYIDGVPASLPGITGLLEYRRDTGDPIRDLTQILLRGESTLTQGERELIATVVSHRNGCRFCATAHTAAADLLLGESTSAEAVKCDPATAPVSGKLRALLVIAAKVQENGRRVTDADAARARAEGATDREIHDTVLIAALFCLYNRYVDGLGAVTPTDPAFYRGLAERIVHRGYLRPPGGFAAGRPTTPAKE
ncbi:MAG TPA: peroxidase-related enzyme [Longimicrobiaceae bacterium]|nr:peroxidase-related enzyme [Longimicrobiaceae bacterium]